MEEQRLGDPIMESSSTPMVSEEAPPAASEKPAPGGTANTDDQQQAETVHNNLRIQVVRTDQGWLLPVEALVIVPFAEFYNAFEKSLSFPDARGELRQNLEVELKQGIDYNRPIVVSLDNNLSRLVLPNAPGGRGRIVMAVARDRKGEMRLEYIRPMMKNLLEACSGAGIRTLAMPLIGTGGDKGKHLEVLAEMLSELLETTPKPPLEQVSIVTLLPEVVAAAKERLTPSLNVQSTEHVQTAAEVTVSAVEILARSQALANDRPEGEDRLGILDEVNALADTLMLQDVIPPLSVAVMGGWGSGKSFILHLIEDRMTERRIWPVQGTDYVGHIYQIKFNAWTYAKSNLWASLMQTIFVELNRQLSLEKLLRDTLKKEDGPYYSLLYEEKIQPDNTLIALLAEGEPDLAKEIQKRGKLDNQILWDRLRERKKKYVQDLAETEKSLADARADLDQALRQRQEQASAAIGGQERVAGFFAVKDLFQKTASEALSRRLKQVISYQDFSPAKINQIRIIAAHRKLTQGEKEKQLGDLGVDKIHIQQLTNTANLDNAAVQQILALDEGQVKEALEDLKSVKGTFYRILKMIAKHWVWTLVFILLFFAVWIFLPALLKKVFTEFSQNYPGVIELIRYLGALIPPTFPIVKVIQKWNSQVNGILDEYEAALERGKAEWQKRQEGWLDQRRAQEMKRVSKIIDKPSRSQEDKIRDLQKVAEAGSLAAQECLVEMLQARAEEQRRLVGPTARFTSLLEFVRSRLDAKDYESQLGLMHQVKLDIDELTSSLSIQDWDDPGLIKAKQDFFPRGPARVVLFIDDLDRCPPPRVVEVLEAVQLLISTELFVVVLGLDTRYITLALEKEYKEILRHEGDPSGLDYIEKIIQIPYGVRPIEKEKVNDFLKFQMVIESAYPPASGPANLAPEEPGKPQAIPDVPGSEGLVGEKTPSETTGSSLEKPGGPISDQQVGPKSTAAPAMRRALQKIREKPHLPSAAEQREVKFKQEDLDDLNLCGTLVELTPRSLRRLVNVLKLAKVYWSRSPSGEPGRPVKQAVIAILAVSAAYPEVMREAFVQIDIRYRKETDTKKETLRQFLQDLRWQKTIEESFASQLRRFRTDVQRLSEAEFYNVTLDAFGQDNFNLVRSFSFVGDPSYWSDRAGRPPARSTPRRPPDQSAQKGK